MSIVLNEREWAMRALDSHNLGNKAYETLLRIAKYYYSEGYSKRQVREKIGEFLIRCQPTASLVAWSPTLEWVTNQAKNMKLIDIPYIPVNENEFNTIRGLKGKQAQRLAFTLLSISKFWDCLSPANDHWVNSPDNEIIRMANIKNSIRRQSLLFAQLRDAGMIRFSKKVDNLNVQVLFAEDGDPVYKITDFRNLGYQYLKLIGEQYCECVNCGITFKDDRGTNGNVVRGRKPIYCRECATEIHLKQTVNSVMRNRA